MGVGSSSVLTLPLDWMRSSRAKMEVATGEEHNPIKQDTKKGKLRCGPRAHDARALHPLLHLLLPLPLLLAALAHVHPPARRKLGRRYFAAGDIPFNYGWCVCVCARAHTCAWDLSCVTRSVRTL
jgi:hypothetical protein